MDPAYLVGTAAMITALTGLYMARRERRKTDEKLDTGNGKTVGQIAAAVMHSLDAHRSEFRATSEANKQEMKSALEAHAREDARRFDELANIMERGGLL